MIKGLVKSPICFVCFLSQSEGLGKKQQNNFKFVNVYAIIKNVLS